MAWRKKLRHLFQKIDEILSQYGRQNTSPAESLLVRSLRTLWIFEHTYIIVTRRLLHRNIRTIALWGTKLTRYQINHITKSTIYKINPNQPCTKSTTYQINYLTKDLSSDTKPTRSAWSCVFGKPAPVVNSELKPQLGPLLPITFGTGIRLRHSKMPIRAISFPARNHFKLLAAER